MNKQRDVKKLQTQLDLVHLILRPVYTIGWKSRKSHFHPTTASSYRIYFFWCSRTFEIAIRLDWFPGHGTTDLCSLILIFLLIKKFILKYFILNIKKFNSITSESGRAKQNMNSYALFIEILTRPQASKYRRFSLFELKTLSISMRLHTWTLIYLRQRWLVVSDPAFFRSPNFED